MSVTPPYPTITSFEDTMSNYPDLSKSERKDALVPDPQEYDMSDPDGSLSTAKARLALFARVVKTEEAEK